MMGCMTTVPPRKEPGNLRRVLAPLANGNNMTGGSDRTLWRGACVGWRPAQMIEYILCAAQV